MNMAQRFKAMSGDQQAAFLMGMQVAAELCDTAGGNRCEKPARPIKDGGKLDDWIIYGQRLRARLCANFIRHSAEQFDAGIRPRQLEGRAGHV